MPSKVWCNFQHNSWSLLKAPGARFIPRLEEQRACWKTESAISCSSLLHRDLCGKQSWRPCYFRVTTEFSLSFSSDLLINPKVILNRHWLPWQRVALLVPGSPRSGDLPEWSGAPRGHWCLARAGQVLFPCAAPLGRGLWGRDAGESQAPWKRRNAPAKKSIMKEKCNTDRTRKIFTGLSVKEYHGPKGKSQKEKGNSFREQMWRATPGNGHSWLRGEVCPPCHGRGRRPSTTHAPSGSSWAVPQDTVHACSPGDNEAASGVTL